MSWNNHPNVRFKGGGNIMGKRTPKNSKTQNKSILTDNDINNILNLSSENINILIEKAEELSKEIKDIPSSKLRDFYDYVVQIEESMDDNSNENWYLKLMLLKPKMAYQASKETDKKKKKPALETLEGEFTKMLDAIKSDENKFKNFKTFFEAVVAYHKRYN
ncbi:type III-A CRISPR-associated protein Csm2 [Methanothermococcus sp.]|uniref:type III-A CRISPR-associated protein Csm2 n=1 Tax=Methanothermococcus sp. TaxID=2614238 RepID=UPI0025D8C4F8|nr:type III-A CRISPR-associated protein Csm2 [Methanothermococcus sp.]